MRPRRLLLWGCLGALLAGCRVGPDYRPPQTSLPVAWTGQAPGLRPGPAPDLAQWWKLLGDPRLDALVERALQTNNDLKAAGARVRAARALRGAAVADLLPTIGSSASLVTARRSANALSFPVRLLDTDTYQAGFDAAWELDVVGGKRRALQAASADLQAVEEERRAVLVTLLAEVARNYVELRGTQARLEIGRRSLRAQQEVVDLTQARFDAGLASELEVVQARALLAGTQSQLPPLEAGLAQAGHRLSVLLGQPPGGLEAGLEPPGPIPATPPQVPTGLPSDLLRRRPDVRRSERLLAAATARIGVAKAELFPKFVLTGSGGLQSLDAGTLLSAGSRFWSAGPALRWRLLEYPRLRAQIKAQTAQQEQALAQFQQTVLLALEEVENALTAYAKEKVRAESLREAVQTNRRSVELAQELYTKGLGEFLNVLLSQRALYQAEDQLAQSERNATQNLAALYKALGGGWAPEAAAP